ncbi:MAG: NB-ARC domain-containing protein [Microcoleus sp.]
MNYDLDRLWQSMVKILDANNKTVGSGFVIREDGYLVTCHHVIYNLKLINVEYRERRYAAQWCENFSNLEVDIAILKINVNDAKRVTISLPKNQVVSVIVYGFPDKEIKQFSKGFDVYGTLSPSPPICTIATYNGLPEVTEDSLWNRKPSGQSTFLAYRISEKVDPGISGGLVLDKETGCAIGVIQSTRSKESYVISWKNIVGTLKELDLDPSAQDAFSVVSLTTEQTSISQPFKTANLPSQGYRQLLGRSNYIDDIIDALNDPLGRRVIAIDGLGGIGKTALAREIAQRCLSLNAGFEEVVWQTASITENSEKMTFQTVLDGIAIQMNEPNLLKLKGEEREIKTRNLLSGRRVLIVLDNMETAKEAQSSIAYQLFSILGYSKALLTSRHRFESSQSDFCSFHIGGIEKDSAIQLISDTATEKNMPIVLSIQPHELEPIIEVTGSMRTGYSPMAIKFMVGQLEKYEPEEMLKHLEGVRLTEENEEIGDRDEFRLFWKRIFLTSLRLLSPLDRKFMGGMTLFEPNIGTKREEIIKSSIRLTEAEFIQARDSTWRISFLEIGQEVKKRYYLHRLTFTFFSTIIQLKK